jgi:putative zinc finger/helix-turn-helix YgiT family protein
MRYGFLKGGVKMKCFNCKAEMLCKAESYHYKESGLENIYLDGIESRTCPSCGEEIINIPAVSELHSKIGQILINKKSLLNGREIRFLRKNAGLSAKKLSGIVGVDKSTISRWENSGQKISAPHDRLVRLIYSGIKNFPKEDIQNLINEGFEEIDPVQDLVRFNIAIQDWCEPANHC